MELQEFNDKIEGMAGEIKDIVDRYIFLEGVQLDEAQAVLDGMSKSLFKIEIMRSIEDELRKRTPGSISGNDNPCKPY